MLTLPRSHARRAFAMGGWAMLLFVLLIGLLVVQSILMYMNMPASPATAPRGSAPFGHTSAYSSGYKAGASLAKVFVWIAPVVIPLVTLGIAWLVGWIVSLMFGKSDDAGNIGACLILLCALSIFGFTTYKTATLSQSAPPTSASSAPNSASPAADPARIAPPPTSAPRPAPAPAQTRPAPSPTRPSPAPAPTAADPGPDARPTIAEFQKSLDSSIAAVVAKGDKLIPTLSKATPHEIRLVNERLTAVAELRTSADELSKLLNASGDDLKTKLTAAGLSPIDAQMTASRWANADYQAIARRMAADALVRLCDKAKDEGELLRDNIAKWTVDAKGEITSKDPSFKSKAGGNRFFVKSEADRWTSTKDRLQGR